MNLIKNLLVFESRGIHTIVVHFTIHGVIFCSFCIVGYVVLLIFATYKSHGFPKLQLQIRIRILRKCISLELNIQREVYYSTVSMSTTGGEPFGPMFSMGV